METNRPRGILSSADREHLENPEKRDRAARHKRENAIPKRFEQAIRDGTPLWEHWDEDTRSAVFDENLSDADFRNGIVGLLALIYAETRERGMFEDLLHRAVQKAELENHDELRKVDVEIQVDPVPRVDLEDAFSRYASLGSFRDITPTEAYQIAKFLRRSHAVEREEIAEAVEYYNRTREEVLDEPLDAPEESEDDESNDMPTDGDMYAPTDEFEE